MLAMGLSMAASLSLAPWAIATPEEAAPSPEMPVIEPVAGLYAAPEDGVVIEARPQAAPQAPIRWEQTPSGTRVFHDDKVLFTFTGDEGVLAARVVHRLNGLQRQGALRSDRITPGRQGDRFAVRVGPMAVIEIDEAFARQQGTGAVDLTLRYVNALRKRLGGQPIQVQASRSFLSGLRSGIGHASWYGGRFHGRRAASGERFDMHAHTAAHKTLPFGTLLLVTNLANGKTALVRVTDRGPYAHGRTLDVSRAAAETLGMLRSGVARVRYTILK